MEILENKAGEVTTGAYLLSITETVNSVQQTGAGALLFIDNYISGLIWETDSIYLFDSHSKDVNGDTLHSLENYMRSVYYNAYPMTIYFQQQFIKVQCTVTAKSAIKCLFFVDVEIVQVLKKSN